MSTNAEAARERMVALMGKCEVCGAPATVSIRGVVITGAVTIQRPQLGWDANGRPVASGPGDCAQTVKPHEELHRYCAEHKPKEDR